MGLLVRVASCAVANSGRTWTGCTWSATASCHLADFGVAMYCGSGEVLLEVPEDISDLLESELYALRDRLQAVALT